MRTLQDCQLLQRILRLFVTVIFVNSFSGCSKSNEDASGTAPVSAETVTGTNPKVNATATNASADTAQKKRRRDEVWEDEKGQKWFGNVPMDAFFDQPYSVASDQTPIGGETAVADANKTVTPTEPETKEVTSTDGAPTSAPMSSSPPPDKTSTTNGSDEWGTLMPIAMLDEEAKSIRGFLRENLQSVGNYNSSMLMIPPKAATLAVLAGISLEHSEKVTWKDDAKYVRDLAKKMNASALQRGAKDQKRLSELFEAMSDTMDRSKPAGLEEPPATDGYAETAAMAMLMNRMEECEKRLKTEAGTEGAMTSRKEMVQLEASILGSLAKVITKPGYGYEDDSEFKGFANDVMNASLTMKTAAESGDFAGFESALTKVSTSCNSCHGKYRSE